MIPAPFLDPPTFERTPAEDAAHRLWAAINRALDRWWQEYSLARQGEADRELARLVRGEPSSYSLLPQRGGA